MPLVLRLYGCNISFHFRSKRQETAFFYARSYFIYGLNGSIQKRHLTKPSRAFFCLYIQNTFSLRQNHVYPMKTLQSNLSIWALATLLSGGSLTACAQATTGSRYVKPTRQRPSQNNTAATPATDDCQNEKVAAYRRS